LRYKDILQTDAENSLLEIVCYEATKQFGDKLVCEEDRLKLANILSEVFKTQWGSSNIMKAIQNQFCVPAPQYSSTTESFPLQKLSEEEWTSSVQRGITQFGRVLITLRKKKK
jgi:hypothetical protein